LFIGYLYKKYINMRQFRIDDSEKDRILNLHESATKRQYLSEQKGTYDIVSSDLKDIDGYNGEKGTYKIIVSPYRTFELNHDSTYIKGDIVTLTPNTTIGIPRFSGQLVFHKSPDYQLGFSIDVEGDKLKIGPTA